MGRPAPPMPLDNRGDAVKIGEVTYRAWDHRCGRCGDSNPLTYTVLAEPRCLKCIVEEKTRDLGGDHPRGRRACLLAGLDYWVNDPPRSCPNGPHILKHERGSNRCVTCAEDRRLARIEENRDRIDGRYKEPPPAPRMRREDAHRLGFSRYVSETPCTRGHTGPRYVSTGGCVECLRRLRYPAGAQPEPDKR